MNKVEQKGFTIVETVMFVAITGLLIAALLSGWTVMINTQRYKDTLDTVMVYIQDQYGLVYNVENDRAANLTCQPGASDSLIIATVVTPTKSRGQSECVMLGRYVRLSNQGTQLTSQAVVGLTPTTPVGIEEDEVIKAYKPTIVQQSIGLEQSSLELPWSSRAVGKGSWEDHELDFAMMLLRSPATGIVHTYIDTTPGTSLDTGAITETNEKLKRICINPDTTVSSSRLAVRIKAHASSQTAVDIWGDGNEC